MQCMIKPSRSHINDTNGQYDVRKSCLEVILMIQTEDTTYGKAVWKSFHMTRQINTTCKSIMGVLLRSMFRVFQPEKKRGKQQTTLLF